MGIIRWPECVLTDYAFSLAKVAKIEYVVIPLSQPEKVPAYGTLRQIQLSHDTENRGKGSWQR